MIRNFTVVGLALALAGPASALPIELLYDVCEEQNTSCANYLLGFVDAYEALDLEQAIDGDRDICVPDAADNGAALAEALVVYLSDHRELREDTFADAGAVVLDVMAEAFPCARDEDPPGAAGDR